MRKVAHQLVFKSFLPRLLTLRYFHYVTFKGKLHITLFAIPMRTIFSVLKHLATMKSVNMRWLSLRWVRLGQQAVPTIHTRLGWVNMCWLSLCWVRLGQQAVSTIHIWFGGVNMCWLLLCCVRLGQQAVSSTHTQLGGVNMCWLSLCSAGRVQHPHSVWWS